MPKIWRFAAYRMWSRITSTFRASHISNSLAELMHLMIENRVQWNREKIAQLATEKRTKRWFVNDSPLMAPQIRKISEVRLLKLSHVIGTQDSAFMLFHPSSSSCIWNWSLWNSFNSEACIVPKRDCIKNACYPWSVRQKELCMARILHS